LWMSDFTMLIILGVFFAASLGLIAGLSRL
jgi:hypothetical protein